MLSRSLFCAMIAVGCMTAVPARAADVQLKGLHLCCANCVSVLEGALGEVTGVSKVTVDRGAASCEFKATDAATVSKALTAIGKAGMYASVTVDGKPGVFPQENVKAGTTADKVVFEQVHLCCRACTNGVVRALEKDEALGIIECNQKDYTVLISAKGGSMLDVAKIQAALNKAGYHAKVKADAGKK
jgi:copper chaperone CopZ